MDVNIRLVRDVRYVMRILLLFDKFRNLTEQLWMILK